jgi:Ca2+-binding RTX toxin-like protein
MARGRGEIARLSIATGMLAFALLASEPAAGAKGPACKGAGQTGTPASEYLRGDRSGAARDRISGGGGHDRVDGFFGTDCARGDAGLDVLFAGKANDLAIGGPDADWIYGGEGNDVLRGNDGDDWLYGGRGTDLLNGGPGLDTCYGQLDGKPKQAPPARDLDGYKGCENVVLPDAAVIEGNHGKRPVPTQACQTLGVPLAGPTAEADVLFGDPGLVPQHDTIVAGDGADTVRGLGWSDCVYGGNGPDWISGDTEKDLITGDAGSDTLYGGDGLDVVYGANPTGQEDPSRDNIDLIDGGPGDDWLNGGPGTDEIYGGDGNDFCRGGESAKGKADDKFRGCEIVVQD